MKRTGFLFMIIGTLTAMSLILPQQVKTAELIAFITPPAGGGAYVLGAGIVTVTNKYMAGDLELVHQASSGTLDGFRRMQQLESANKASFGLFGTGDGWNAYKGKNEYAGKPYPTLRSVILNNRTDVYLVVPANSPIKSWADVKGKRIALGGAGSSVANTALILLEYSGITKKDFKPYYYVYRETVEGIGDGSLDGGIIAGGYPIAAYAELSTTHNVRIVPVEENVVKKVLADHPYFFRNVVKAKSYKNVEQDTTIVGFTGTIFTHAGVSADFIYKFLKNLFAHLDEYYSIHRAAKVLTSETAMEGIPVPFHPGAERFYKEVGIMKK